MWLIGIALLSQLSMPALSISAGNNNQVAGNIIFQLTSCEQFQSNSFCDELKSSINNVNRMMGKQLWFPAGLKVEIKVDKQYFESNNLKNAVAFTEPTNYYPYDDGLFYPQALARQLYFHRRSTPAFEPYDVEIRLNPALKELLCFQCADKEYSSQEKEQSSLRKSLRKSFLRKKKEGEVIKDKEKLDVEFVLLHEMLHGLGFLSSFGPWLGEVEKNNRLITPKIQFNKQSIYTSNLTKFDTFLYIPQLEVTFPDLASSLALLTQGDRANLDAISWLKEFKSNSKVFSLFEKASQWINTPGGVHIRVPVDRAVKGCAGSGKGYLDMVMYSNEDQFELGTSLSHFWNMRTSSPDFLMMTKVPPGYSLAQLVTLHGGVPIGDAILAILIAMGYQKAKTV